MKHPQYDIDKMAKFLKESYAIEGIHNRVPMQDILAALDFMKDPSTSVERLSGVLCNWIDLVQPFCALRTLSTQNVQVGNHVAPRGGDEIRWRFEQLIDATMQSQKEEGLVVSVFEIHRRFQNLHPFIGGNGRAGRLLSLRHAYFQDKRTHDMMMSLGWLHTWYYLSLSNYDFRDQ